MCKSLDVSDRIKKVAKSKNLPIGEILQSCGLSKNTLSTMQSREYLPRIETIVKIADYLDVSVDYLLCRVDNPQWHKSPSVSFGNMSNNSGIVGNVGSTINSGTVSLDEHQKLLFDLYNMLSPIEQIELIASLNNRKK